MTGILLEIFENCIKISNENKFLEERGEVEMRISISKLIKINYDTKRLTVSARDLHEQIGSAEEFSSWFERQLQFGFEENEDYTKVKSFTIMNEEEQEVENYDLSFDTAKEICIVQKNERAREIRKYLIKIEEIWNEPEKIMARTLKMADKMIDSLELENQELQLKVKEREKQIEEMNLRMGYYDLILECKNLMSTTIIAQDYGMTVKAFNKLLCDLHIQYKMNGLWVLYKDYQNRGYTGTKRYTNSERTYWTPLGRKFLYRKLKQEGYLPLTER